MSFVRRVLPWLIAAALLYYLFRLYPGAEVLAAARHVNLAAFCGFLIFYFAYWVLADSWSLRQTLNRFGIGGGFAEILSLRLASNLPMILHYGAGQGFLAYLIKRRCNVSLARSSSVLIFVMAIDLYWALTIAFVGSFFTSAVVDGVDLVQWIRGLWLVAGLVLMAVLVFWRLPLREEKLRWRTARDLFHTFHSAGSGDYVAVLAWRFPLHCATSTYLYFLAPCFGVNIPFASVLTLLPITVVIGAIPVTPSGIGTVQVVSIVLFQDHVSGGPVASREINGAEIIFAMSILFTLGVYLLKLISGSLLFRRAMNAR